MFRFLIGAALGAFAAYYLQQRPTRDELERRMREVQDRSSALLEESRRVLEETRAELGQALEAGRSNVVKKAERLRSAAVGETGIERETGI